MESGHSTTKSLCGGQIRREEADSGLSRSNSTRPEEARSRLLLVGYMPTTLCFDLAGPGSFVSRKMSLRGYVRRG
ncbi:hypothetical protein SCA6_014478 [Theobroma cacao]